MQELSKLMTGFVPKSFPVPDKEAHGLAFQSDAQLLLKLEDRPRTAPKGTVIEKADGWIQEPDSRITRRLLERCIEFRLHRNAWDRKEKAKARSNAKATNHQSQPIPRGLTRSRPRAPSPNSSLTNSS